MYKVIHSLAYVWSNYILDSYYVPVIVNLQYTVLFLTIQVMILCTSNLKFVFHC